MPTLVPILQHSLGSSYGMFVYGHTSVAITGILANFLFAPIPPQAKAAQETTGPRVITLREPS